MLRDMINDDASGSSVKKARVLGDGDVGDIMYSGLVDSSSNVPKAGPRKSFCHNNSTVSTLHIMLCTCFTLQNFFLLLAEIV